MTFGKIKLFGTQSLLTATEKRNILIYIFGIMLYKFGVEAFNGAIITMATNRYDQDAHEAETSTRTFEKVGLIIGLNQACQCFGSVLIGPLIKRWRTQYVLSVTMFIFALSTAVFMIVDVATGGYIKPSDFVPEHKNDFSYYGNYRTDVIIPIYCVSGITFGMIESIRRVIPANIVGDNIIKLRKMNALVHVFYEIAGVSGALMTALVLIPRLGNNHAFIITPILFTASGLIWLFIYSVSKKTNNVENDITPPLTKSKVNYLKSIVKGLLVFVQSLYVGAKIVFTSRKFIWLFAAYPLAVYSHRYIENSIAPQVARRYLHNSDWSQILVGGSNLGELLGAIFVYFFNDIIKTPIPWVRLDALMLFIIWYIPFYHPPVNQVKYAWIIAASLIPVGFGSAIGDISLDAYIQSSLSRLESKHKNVSPLGAVMAFLYSTYIVIYAIANPLLGRYLDYVYNTSGTVQSALIYTAAVQLTIVFIVIFGSTFIPKGAIAFNPVLIDKDETIPPSDVEENLNVTSDKIEKEEDSK
jgi:MFS family permease